MNLKKDGIYCMYLRKSRADVEAEQRGQYETLSHHMQILTELADRYGIKVYKIYKEIVSGDSIEDRPEVQKLLDEVSNGVYDGVLVTEISRLARGRTTDQGTVSETFLRSGTLIITPSKVYDPADEADETFFDFELFMARQEYKYIKKRMQRGRELSRKNGNWIFPKVPVGYQKDGLRLVPGEHSDIMKNALLDFAGGKRNLTDTTKMLQTLIPDRVWALSSTRYTITNPIYAGYHRRGSKQLTPSTLNVSEYYPVNCDPLISLEDHIQIVQRITPRPPRKNGTHMTNAFAGLIKCSQCGRALTVYTNHGRSRLAHRCGADNHGCICYSILYQDAYDSIVDKIIADLPDLTYTEEQSDYVQREIDSLQRQLDRARLIKQNLFQKLEDGLYTASEFKERKMIREKEIDALESRIAALNGKLKRPSAMFSTHDLISTLKNGDVKQVNDLLKLFISKIEYTRKTPGQPPDYVIYYK